jgi:hypothetical protein
MTQYLDIIIIIIIIIIIPIFEINGTVNLLR